MTTVTIETSKSNKFFEVKNVNFDNPLVSLAKSLANEGVKYSLPNYTITAPIYLRPMFERKAGLEVTPLPRLGNIVVFVHEYPSLNEKNQLVNAGKFEITQRLEKDLFDKIKQDAKYVSFETYEEEREDGIMFNSFSGWQYTLHTVKAAVKAGYSVTMIDNATRVEVTVDYDFTLCFATTQILSDKVAEYKKAQAQAKAEAQAVELAKNEIITNSVLVNTETVPSGKVVHDTTNAYGSGDKFVITDTEVWYLVNNSMDSDDWSRNNVAGRYIGYAVPLKQSIVDALLA